jgi:HK97 family phage major capsid protein
MKTTAEQIKALKEERAGKIKQMDGLIDKAEAEKRNLSTEEDGTYKSLQSEVDGYTERLSRLEEKQKREMAEAAQKGSVVSPVTFDTQTDSEGEKRDISKFSFGKLFRAAANRSQLDGIEGEMMKEAQQEMQRAGASPSAGGYQIPLVVLRNTQIKKENRDMSATTTTAGGHNVATDLVGYIEALREVSRVTQLGADFQTGAVGNIDMPRENAIFTPGWTATENANSSESSPTYTKVTFTPKRLAGYMDVSNQLLLQTAPGFENRLRNQMITGQGEAIDIGAINGAGSSGEPEGILQTSGIGSVVGGTDGAAPDRDDLLDLWTAVANAKGLSGNLNYLSNPKAFSKLAKTKTDSGSGLFILDKSKEFMGYNFGVSNNVPSNLVKGSSGAVCSAIIFGNFSDLMIVQWGGLEILVDPYTQAIAGLTRMHVNSFVDIHVLRPASFAAMKDALTV